MPTNEKLPPDGYELGPGWTLKLKRHWFCTAGDGRCPYSATYGYQKRGSRSGAGACHVHAETMGAIVRKAAPVCCPRGRKGLNGQHEIFCPGNDETRAANAIVRKAEAPTFEQLVAKVGPLASTAMASAEAPQILQPESLPTSENITSPANHYLAAEAPSPVVAPRSRMPDAPTRLPPEVVAAIHASAESPPEQPSRNPLRLPPEAHAAPVGSLAEEVLRILHAFNSGDSRRDDVRALAARIAALEAELVEAKAKLESTLMDALGEAVRTSEAVQAERERCAAAFHRHWNSDDFCAADYEAEIRNGDPKP